MPLYNALLVEDAVNQVTALLQRDFNAALQAIYDDYQPDVQGIEMQLVEANRFYISEAVEPLQAPAVFVVASHSRHMVEEFQNFAGQEHDMLVGVLVEDIEVTRLTLKAYRYARAAFITLHDQNSGNVHCLVDEIDYSPIFATAGGAASRSFRKDATLRVRVQHFEPF